LHLKVSRSIRKADLQQSHAPHCGRADVPSACGSAVETGSPLRYTLIDATARPAQPRRLGQPPSRHNRPPGTTARPAQPPARHNAAVGTTALPEQRGGWDNRPPGTTARPAQPPARHNRPPGTTARPAQRGGWDNRPPGTTRRLGQPPSRHNRPPGTKKADSFAGIGLLKFVYRSVVRSVGINLSSIRPFGLLDQSQESSLVVNR